MNYLEIDIETFSSVDLKKCGLYKYAESDDFGIMLFGYAVDGGEVEVVDLAQGEKIPDEVISVWLTTLLPSLLIMLILRESVCRSISENIIPINLQANILILSLGNAPWSGLRTWDCPFLSKP